MIERRAAHPSEIILSRDSGAISRRGFEKFWCYGVLLSACVILAACGKNPPTTTQDGAVEDAGVVSNDASATDLGTNTGDAATTDLGTTTDDAATTDLGTAGMDGATTDLGSTLTDAATADLGSSSMDAGPVDLGVADLGATTDAFVADAGVDMFVDMGPGSCAGDSVYFKASNTAAQQLFGTSVSISADGNTLAVGAYGDKSNARGINGDASNTDAYGAGAVHLFRKSIVDGRAMWAQEAYIKASNTIASQNFGIAVSLSADGNTLAVGATFESSNATGINGDQTNTSATASGAVYVFRFASSAWSQEAYVKASNTHGGDSFGSAVALSADGNTLAVSAVGETGRSVGINHSQTPAHYGGAGAVYLFRFASSAWSQQAYIKSSNTRSQQHFGAALAISADSNTLAVGAYGESSIATGINGIQNNASAPESGAVYLFRFAGSTPAWSQQAYIKASNTRFGMFFGSSVALSSDGNTLAAGAEFEESNAMGINGDQTSVAYTSAGAAYLFRYAGSTPAWSQQAYIKASNTHAGQAFGSSVALSSDGNALAVGAPNEGSHATCIGGYQYDLSDGYSGAVYSFRFASAAWTQHAYIKPPVTLAGQHFGTSISLPADGTFLAAGAPNESSSAVGVNGDATDNGTSNAGAAYVFRN